MTSPASQSDFYVTGGTLRRDAPSYVQRQADLRLYSGLTQGSFCYVLTSRQMGKSSLMVRTAARLRTEGISVAVLDLTAIGQNLTAEQWYDGLLSRIGQQLDLEQELDSFWLEHVRMAPLQRFMRAVREVALIRHKGRIVVFVDEIDAVRSLPFSTDEFFAAIREVYNRRSEDEEFVRLNFCLLGVATPSDLVRDPRTTPFNIGQRIELTDFTTDEAGSLARGLGRTEPVGEMLLRRVLHWTGGHPYLTQRLCQAISQDESVAKASDVDRVCEELFLTTRSRERDDNLLFVRERLLRSEVDLPSLLEMYSQVQRKRVRDDDTNPLIGILRLSGITRVVAGNLHVRNLIYDRVFDQGWVTANMPDADLRRQRAAYRRGLLRSAAVGGLIIFAMTALVVVAVNQRNSAREQRGRAEQQEAINRRLLYAAQMKLAQQAWEDANLGFMNELLEGSLPRPGQEDLRGFEWFYLWHLSHSAPSNQPLVGGSFRRVPCVAFSPDGKALAAASGNVVRMWDVVTRQDIGRLQHDEQVNSIAFSRDGKLLVTGSSDNTARIWDAASKQELAALKGHSKPINAVAFSPAGKIVATASSDNTTKLWDAATRRERATLKGHSAPVRAVAYSPDGKMIATASQDNSVKLWDSAGRELATLKGHTGWVLSVSFSPDNKYLATGSEDNTVKLWDMTSRQEISTLRGHAGWVHSVAFSPDGMAVASASQDKIVKIWDLTRREERATLKGHTDGVHAVAFSPDGKSVATGGLDGAVRVWDSTSKQEITTLIGHNRDVFVVSFSPDGKLIVSGGADKTALLWDAVSSQMLARFGEYAGPVVAAGFSPDGKTMVVGTDLGQLIFLDVATRREVATLTAHADGINSAVFSSDGKYLVTASLDKTIKLWYAATHELVRTLEGHTEPVSSAVLSPDARMIASASGDGTVRLWDTATGQELAVLQGHNGSVRCVDFSPDGQMLATGADDKTVKLWDVETRQVLAALTGHTSYILALAFSPDGKRLVTASFDQTVKVWSTKQWQELLTLKGHRGYINALAFSPDGKTLATASQDQTVKLWEAASDEEVLAQKRGLAE